MSKKQGGGRAAAFLNGRGFYVVLFLCVAAIGISAYVVYLTGNLAGGQLDDSFTGSNLDDLLSSQTNGDDMSDFFDDLTSKPTESSAPVVSPVDNIPKTTVTTAATATTATTAAKEPLFVMPIDGETAQAYSGAELVYNPTLEDWRTHNGLDIKCAAGAQVCAMADGTVEKIYTDDFMGVCVVIAHAAGYKSLYANLQENVVVKENAKINSGTVIGGVGISAAFEALDGSHLHVEVTKDGKYVDPLSVIKKPWAEPVLVEIDE